MSLEIRLLTQDSANSPFDLSLDNDGYYWYMHPWFEELARETGRYIDLYGETEFTAQQIPRLRELLAQVRSTIEDRPRVWNVSIGTLTYPERK